MMRTLLSLFVMVALCGTFAYAQDDATPENYATIEFETDVHDFGQLVEGDDAAAEFKFKNTGNIDLILTNVKPGCGCTTPFWSKEPIPPGGTGTITAKYNTVGRVGRFNKPITVTSNATNPTERIYIKGEVLDEPVFSAPEKKPSIVNQQ